MGEFLIVPLFASDNFNNVYRKVVRINDMHGDMLATVLANMPQHLRSNVLETIKTVFPNRVKNVDSQDEGYTFDAIHFSYWNVYAKKVCKISMLPYSL